MKKVCAVILACVMMFAMTMTVFAAPSPGGTVIPGGESGTDGSGTDGSGTDKDQTGTDGSGTADAGQNGSGSGTTDAGQSGSDQSGTASPKTGVIDVMFVELAGVGLAATAVVAAKKTKKEA